MEEIVRPFQPKGAAKRRRQQTVHRIVNGERRHEGKLTRLARCAARGQIERAHEIAGGAFPCPAPSATACRLPGSGDPDRPFRCRFAKAACFFVGAVYFLKARSEERRVGKGGWYRVR